MRPIGQGQLASIAIPEGSQVTLARIEEEIREHLDAFQKKQVAICQLFCQIRDQRLYLGVNKPTFVIYCADVWGWKGSQAYNMASAGEAINFLISNGEEVLPQSIEQAAALCKVPFKDRLAAWKHFYQEGVPLPIKKRNSSKRVVAVLSNQQPTRSGENSGTPEFSPDLASEDGDRQQMPVYDADTAVSWLLSEFDISQLAIALAKGLSEIDHRKFRETFLSISITPEVDVELGRANSQGACRPVA